VRQHRPNTGTGLAEIATSGKKLSATKKKADAKKALVTDRVTDSEM
jgi:hypothetical protein